MAKKLLLLSILFIVGFLVVFFSFSSSGGVKTQTANISEKVSLPSFKRCEGGDAVICIVKVLRLDENKSEIEDITSKVEKKDDNWADIKNGQYVRIVFEKILDNRNDITIFARAKSESGAYIDVYSQDTPIGRFSEIRQGREYKFLLSNLTYKSDTFDLKMSGDIDIDYIVDPDSPGIEVGSGIELSSGIEISAPCSSSYTPDPSWTKTADTLVRDIAGAYNTTIAKDIYCDDYNCVLWTDGAAAPGTLCIATDANVYANILWSKTDEAGTYSWADSGFSISGGDIGGTHPAGLTAGSGNVDIGIRNWIAREYTSAAGTFNAMDVCKLKGAGWRLPNALELDSIRDQAKGGDLVSRLNGIVSSAYWSSSEDSATDACQLDFFNGFLGTGDKSNVCDVRCVRGAM